MELNAQIFTLRSVFIAMSAIQLATAASGTLVPLVFSEIGASQAAVSLAASAYSAGFLLGCFFVSRFISDFGHIRASAAAAAIASSAAVLFSMGENEALLIALRFLVGLSTALLFSIGDAWVNEQASEAARGRVLSVYSIALGIVAVASQAMIFIVPNDTSEIFVAVSLIYSFAIIVISTTRTNPPDTGAKIVLRIRGLIKDSPAAAVGAFANGMVTTTVLSVAPFNAAELGVRPIDIAICIAIIYLGRVLLQYPIGAMSDRFDRRSVIVIVSAVSSVILLAMAILSDPDYAGEAFDYSSVAFWIFAFLLFALGSTLLTLYSVLVAHALDRTVPVFVSSTAVTMLFVWTMGSVTGPLLASILTNLFADAVLNWMNFGITVGVALFVALRIRQAAPSARAESADYVNAMTMSTEIIPEVKRS